jgi:hypothetical protein
MEELDPMTDIELVPRPPYNFPLSAAIFSGGDPAIRTYENGVFRQTLEIEGQPIHIGLESQGTTEHPGLILSVSPDPERAGVGESAVRDTIMLCSILTMI